MTPDNTPSHEGADALQAGGLVITDDMVERGAQAVCKTLMGGACPVRPRHYDTARTCLEAALLPGGGS